MTRSFKVPVGLLASASDPTGTTAGETYYNTATNKIRVYNGSAWADAGIQGTQGLAIQGTIGTQGIVGSQGANGTQGTVGSQGVNGTQGLSGTQGINGLNGSQGTVGNTGAQGTQGITGLQGIQGILGTGVQGTAGANGNAYIVDYLDGGGSSITPDIIYDAGNSTTSSWTYTIDASGATVSF